MSVINSCIENFDKDLLLEQLIVVRIIQSNCLAVVIEKLEKYV